VFAEEVWEAGMPWWKAETTFDLDGSVDAKVSPVRCKYAGKETTITHDEKGIIEPRAETGKR
jgi:hypothetical protein